MLQHPRVLRSSPQPFNPSSHTSTPSHSSFQQLPTTPHFPNLKQQCRLSRRELAIYSNTCLLLLLGSGSRARAAEDVTNSDKLGEDLTKTPSCTERKPTKQVFFDVSIDREPVGRVTIELYGDDVPAGVERFSKIVSGAAGISYRRKEFVKIMPNYVQHGGLRSYGVDAELANKTGSNLATEKLVEEWESVYEKCPGTKNVAGSVGIIVRDPSKPPPKFKLVARLGKLEIDQEEVGTDPNGTEFVIATKDSPELDASTLVIGRVVGGMEFVQKISQVKTVQENTSSPYFRVAKLIGDKRAVVAERGFNRPYSKVVITNCGVIQ
ncbi:putative peptidylprolyl isomerase [Medicago truncatula]|uniref:Peptidyl-prolyl cis-trans isomerase n=3 Tax=Medicago truncatula TaxID=3880 RepID=G7JRX9_MEDTR|nr:peptidyl-prolyl cis-trans isomerase CYP26-2, chloroplastic [Medicago truncatula]AES91276.1 peptidyl-prolyl cis-trans isomerase [Medicago truncatula]RHN63813.1 putative peptidylprolyl isomerase [Medicago truncatula]